MRAYALWLFLSLAGAKDTDDKCDPTRERDDAMCLQDGERDHSCCACLGSGSCLDGYAYETSYTWTCDDGIACPADAPRAVTGCCYAPGAEPATYMDEYDGLCVLIIVYLVLSAMVGIVGCVCAKESGHWAGRTLAEAPAAVPVVSDIEATTIANPLLPSETPSAPPAPEPAPTPSAPPWEPMFTDNEAFKYATPAFLAPTEEDTTPEGMAVEPGVGVGKPSDDAPPAYVEQPALVPEGQTAEAVPVAEQIEAGAGCGPGCGQSPHLKCLFLTVLILFIVVPLPFCNATWLYQGKCADWWNMRSYGREEDASDNAFWILLVCYLAECLCFSDTHKFLWNLTRDSALKPHIEQVKRSRPIIRLRIQCYHFETHHWWETVKDQHGRERRVRRSKEVRVNTHAASHVYQYSWVRDSGGDAYNRWPATLLAKVEFGKRWTFGDDYTRQHFGMYKRRFIRHHRRDRHFDFSQDFELPEFRERLLVEMFPGAKPRHASPGWYWVANLLLLTWPCGRGAVARCLRLLSARRRRRDIVLAGTACGSIRSVSGAATST